MVDTVELAPLATSDASLPLQQTHRTDLRTLLPLYLVVFIGFCGYSLMITLFAPMLMGSNDFLPADATVAQRSLALGLLLAIYPLGQFLGSPVLGALSDRHGRKPVLNGYLIERLLCKEPEITYNDLVQWRYADLPHAFGCDRWFTARVTTCGELDDAMKTASAHNSGSYIEVVTDTYAASRLALKLHDAIKTLYKS